MTKRFSIVVLAALALPACGDAPKPEPEIASSAKHGGYASGWVASLNQSISDFNDRQNVARKALAGFNGFPGALKETNWFHVIEIVDASDEDGREYQYVERIRQVDGAHAFYEAEKDEIVRHVAGSTQFIVKKAKCDVETQGAVQASLKESVEKQLQKELRDASEGQLLIERYKNQLGKENVTELEKQADAIAFASYLVHIELVELKVRIKRLVDESEQVKRTYEEFALTEKKYQGEKGTTAADKKASDDRIAEMNKSKAGFDAAMLQAQNLVPKLDEQMKTITKEYDDAFATLKARLEDKAKQSH